MIRAALLAVFRLIVRLYFRRIESAGTPPAAEVRGRIIVANHPNALIDPIVILTAAPAAIAPIAKRTLWDIPVLGWLLDGAGAVPIARRRDDPGKDARANDETFAVVARHLADGGNILIFPEGTSHSGPRLAPLRTGAARMLAAAAALGRTPPTFQAVALEYDAADTFRSRCLVVWGPVRAWRDVDGDAELQVRTATDQMAADLSALLIEADTPEERRRIVAAAELLANESGDDSLAASSAIGRRIEEVAAALSAHDAPSLDAARRALDGYVALLDRHGVRDAQLARGLRPGPRSPARWLRRLLLAPLAVAGIALYAIPYRIPRRVARGGDADVVSTLKLAAGLVVFPLWATLLTIVAWWWRGGGVAAIATATVWLSPFAALRWLDWRDRRRQPLTAEELAALVAARAGALAALEAARAAGDRPRG